MVRAISTILSLGIAVLAFWVLWPFYRDMNRAALSLDILGEFPWGRVIGGFALMFSAVLVARIGRAYWSKK